MTKALHLWTGRPASFLCFLLLVAIELFIVRPAVGQGNAHQKIRNSLVHLSASGVMSEDSPTPGVRANTEATGFLISEDGLIMTTYHLLGQLGPKVDGQTVTVSARLGRKSGPADFENVPIMNAMPLLDLLLLKVDLSDPQRVSHQPAALGTAEGLTPNQEVFVAGFPQSETNIVQDSGNLAARSGPRGHLWTMNDMPLEGGQSGSPVYDDTGTVVAIAKGSNTGNPSRSYVVPIQFADPLIAHLRLQRISWRVNDITATVDGLRRYVASWHATLLADDRGIELEYTKLIPGEPHVKEIEYRLFVEGSNTGGRATLGQPRTAELSSGGGDTRSGTFVLEDAAQKLKAARTAVNDGKRFDTIELRIFATLTTGEELPLYEIKMSDSPEER